MTAANKTCILEIADQNQWQQHNKTNILETADQNQWQQQIKLVS